MSSIAIGRLTEERKNWRKDHPSGFFARPKSNADGSTDLMNWELGIPGPEGSDWEGGVYKVCMKFPSDYPVKPPKCTFVPTLFHPNVFSNGDICLSIINEHYDWRPSITVKQIALGIQTLLVTPNPNSPANGVAENMYRNQPGQYKKKIREQALKHAEVE